MGELIPVLALLLGFVIALFGLYFPAIRKRNADIGQLKSENKALAEAKNQLDIALNRVQVDLENRDRQLAEFRNEQQKLEELLNKSFEGIAHKILINSSTKMQEQHIEKLSTVLNPLKEKINEFELKVERTHNDSIARNEKLKEQITQLSELNKALGEEAKNLTAALKGDKKLQGDWGEKQLETILQSAGLSRDIHYHIQESLRDNEGSIFRPDVIVNLPDNKNLIIDSKVSLNAYESYFNEEDNTAKRRHLQTFVGNIRSHIKQLSGKDYPGLYGIQPPDYVLMYIPLDSSLYLATVEEPGLFEEAIRQHVVLVSNTTLFATLRTISYIWQQDSLNKNTQQIARESATLYDKFVGFVQSMDKLGGRIKSVQTEYDDALNKLSKGRGNLVSKAENLKKLGLQSKKDLGRDLPGTFLERTELEEDEIE